MPEARGAGTLRLRQICLVAASLAPHEDHLHEIFGLEACHRDPNVARYGLENVLFPVGTDFIEIVAPTRPGTAAGRFLERHGGRDGYMLIMDCDDPRARQAHCASLGIRTAHLIEHPGYLGAQLHPGDTGGAMLEFNRTEGGGDARGPYGPAGPGWARAIRQDVTLGLRAAEMECADPVLFAAHWARILQRPVEDADGRPCIPLDAGTIRFLPGGVEGAALTGIEVQVADLNHVRRAAKARGCLTADGRVDLCGVKFRLLPAEPASRRGEV